MPDPSLRYEVRFPRPQTHLYEVTLSLEGLAAGEHRLEMAVWTPGSYLLREYSGLVHNLAVDDGGGQALAWRKERKNVWAFEAQGPTARVTYEVYSNDLTVDTSHLDASHAYWNGASLFFALDGRKELPIEVRVEAPTDWRVATGLDIVEAADGRFTLRAADYDTLLDCPVEVGTHRTFTFQAMGKAHEVALYGHGNEDAERFVDDLRRIVEAAGAVFGGLPYERYVFIVHLADGLGGGLEDMNSTTCDAGRFDFRPEATYLRLLWLFSHEFFHLWNVKRIHPEALGPFEYGEENYTTLLWAMEGVTDYYAFLLLARAGLWSERKYAQALGAQIRDYERLPGRLVQSASDASYDAWVKFYRPNEDSPNHTISYYTKGSLLGLCLDLEIRRRTDGERGLDDVLRRLFERYGSRGVGFPEATYKQVAEEVAEGSLDDFWRRYVDGVEEIDFGAFFGYAGLGLERRVARGEADGDDANRPAGDVEAPKGEGGARAYLGVTTRRREGRLTVTHVFARSPAEEAGVNVDDEPLFVNGYRVADTEALGARVRDEGPGGEARLTVSRRGEMREMTARLVAAPPDEYRLDVRTGASEGERRVYEGWLGHPFPAQEDALRAEPMRAERTLRDLI